ncbi:paired amphipathic helix protein Sin3-like 2 [Vicia villosa]|uniref:paired amphipathic helix protein Sin3-like 2 n=1 Tax=Vicia villosa TaxID=3911 RepID=UPI00273AD9B1|nr:paired amphipathic helix protein Sin3-like 2 [Vicia villosa]
MLKSVRESGTKKPITSDDAHMYLEEVKDAFKDQKYKYSEFLRTMKDFNLKRINVMDVVARVEILFKGNEELLLKFNDFLPNAFEIKSSPKKPSISAVNKEDANKYLDKVKNRFQHQLDVYDSFLDIMIKYKNKDKNLEEIYDMVISLFEDHPDLIDGFTIFLP